MLDIMFYLTLKILQENRRELLKKLVILRRRRRGQPKAADGRGSSGDGGVMDTWVPEAGQTPSWNVDQQAVGAEEICSEQRPGNIRDPEALTNLVSGTKRNRKRPPGIGLDGRPVGGDQTLRSWLKAAIVVAGGEN